MRCSEPEMPFFRFRLLQKHDLCADLFRRQREQCIARRSAVPAVTERARIQQQDTVLHAVVRHMRMPVTDNVASPFLRKFDHLLIALAVGKLMRVDQQHPVPAKRKHTVSGKVIII